MQRGLGVKWRLLADRNADPALGLATDAALAQCSAPARLPILRLYTYKPCALIGRFQQLEDEVQVEYCQAQGIPFNRRPSGGGSIIMGPDQLGIALAVPGGSAFAKSRSADMLAHCARGLVKALAGLGIDAQVHGKNDLAAAGRKIAGLGLYRTQHGNVLFHASLLLDIDIPFMLHVLRVDLPQSAESHCELVGRRISTVRSESCASMQMPALIDRVAAGYCEEFGVELERSDIKPEELAMAQKLCEEQYSTSKWIEQTPVKTHDQVGKFKLRTLGGTIDVRAIVAGETVKSVMVGGSFIASDNAVFDLESSLRWHARDVSRLRHTVFDSYQRNADAWNQLNAQEIADAVAGAVEQCSEARPYRIRGTCFANRDGENA